MLTTRVMHTQDILHTLNATSRIRVPRRSQGASVHASSRIALGGTFASYPSYAKDERDHTHNHPVCTLKSVAIQSLLTLVDSSYAANGAPWMEVEMKPYGEEPSGRQFVWIM